MTNEAHYSTEWGIAEWEPPPSLYIVELDRSDITMLVSAAERLSKMPGVSKAEAELFMESANRLAKQTTNL